MSEELEKSRHAWDQTVLRPALERFPERKAFFQTPSGLPEDRVYFPSLPDQEYETKLGFPGQYPFTRGIHPTMYRARLWTMRQYAGYASAEETNQRFRYLLAQGQTGLSVAFDLPTQLGLDADDPLASGEVGKVGVSISSLEDMNRLFQDIPLDEVSTSMTINSPAAIIMAMYLVIAKRQGVDISLLRGTIQNDILKEYVARGTYIFPPAPAMRLITDIFRYCHKHTPSWNPISISGYHLREAGATAIQEVAFTLANGIAYVEAAIDAGMAVDDFGPRLTFFFSTHNHFMEEIAKFRAARRLWSACMQSRFSASNPAACQLRFHTQTAGSTLQSQQPENNIVRVAFQALAAVLGGSQSIHTNSMDEALGLPSQHAAQIALRTQQIIAHETGVADTVDPIAGSYFLEHLTDALEIEMSAYIQKIDALGGALPAIEGGFFQREIEDAAYQTQKAIDSGEQIVVGLNQYQTEATPTIFPLKVDPAIETHQVKRLLQFRERRDAERASAALDLIKKAAQSEQDLMPLFIHGVEVDLTLGEICRVLRDVWGEHRPSHPFGG